VNPNQNQPSVALNQLPKTAEILAQIGEELAFVSPDQDSGLLPINRFIMDLEELAGSTAPAPWAAALSMARRWLDGILDGTGKFSAESIAHFNTWHGHVSAVLDSLDGSTPLPEWPAAWDPALRDAALKPKQNAAPSVPAPATSPAPKAAPAAPAAPAADEPSMRLNLAEDQELLREFHGESVELLQSIEQGLLVLESNPSDADTINSIFRAFHTFKGGAGFLHLDALRDLAHDLESLLEAVRRSELKINSEIIDLILAGSDALKLFTQEIGSQLQGKNAGAPIQIPILQIIRRVKSTLRGEPAPAPAPAASAPPLPAAAPAIVPTAAPVPVAPQATTPPALTQAPAPAPKPAAPPVAAPESVPAAPAPISKTPPPPPQAAQGEAGATLANSFVKLDTAKLDSLVDLVGELVIAQSMVVQNPDVQSIQSLPLARCLRQLSRITTELQRNAMSLRMVPIRAVFHKMNRLVRDLAAQQQKQVQLLLDGEDTELDRNIVEKLGDPLIHMIRNAVDHGLESSATRTAQGKPAQGTIRLSASHQRGGIVIRIQDDGKGLDRARIRAKAVERGLVSPDAELSESEIFGLIFLPGFSTAEKVTDLSGRGVGMDVVRRNIENLRGKIEIQSVLGQGTTFTILLPLTLAIIDGLLVGVGTDRYIIPTLSIRESFRPQPGMVKTVHEHGEMVNVRGRQTPLLRLGRHLGRPSKAVNPEDGIIVVVESGDAARGLLVDELIGKQEVVIKSLGQTFQHQNLLAGSAVLGDGWVGLILDVDTLVKMPHSSRSGANIAA